MHVPPVWSIRIITSYTYTYTCTRPSCVGYKNNNTLHLYVHLHPSLQTMMRIWDTFLYEGSKVLFRYAIAIFKHNEEQLLALDNSIAIFNHLRTMCANALDADGITKVGVVMGHCILLFVTHTDCIINCLQDEVHRS